MIKAEALQTVTAYLARFSTLRTRLRERSAGAAHDVPWGVPAPLGTSLAESELTEALEQLEAEGIVARREEVTAGDSSEYAVTWALVRPG